MGSLMGPLSSVGNVRSSRAVWRAYRGFKAFVFCFEFLRVNIACIMLIVISIKIVTYVFINIRIL